MTNTTPLLTAELEEIRAADAAMGEGPEALQMWPIVYTQRRGLLGHIGALEEVLEDKRRLTRELDVALNGPNAAAQASLCDIVGQIQHMKRLAQCPLCAGSGAVTVNAGPHAGEVHECPNGCKVKS
jgi:hypothetical protein